MAVERQLMESPATVRHPGHCERECFSLWVMVITTGSEVNSDGYGYFGRVIRKIAPFGGR